MDTVSPEKRSETMSKIRSKNTKPELVVRHHLHMLGFRYRLHSPKLPGHPDIVLPKWHTVIFINGCFWHRHEGCKVATMPKSNVEFWTKKFERNVERDKKEQAALKEAGWHVLVIWECEIKKRLNSPDDNISKVFGNKGRKRSFSTQKSLLTPCKSAIKFSTVGRRVFWMASHSFSVEEKRC